ncbi:MAG: magnesium transporter, partial [Pseudomonadota bacterium]
IHMEDAMEVLDEEADEDLKRLAGVGDESLSDKVWETICSRAPWLSVSCGAALLSALVIAQFDAALEAIVALAILMPVVSAMGGNAGTQTMTVTVRALATKDLTPANAWRIVRRELLTSLGTGAMFGAVLAAVSFAWFGEAGLSAVLGASLVFTFFMAAAAGVAAPLALERAGVDPAIASGPFVTTTIDVVGFFSFLGLATVALL